MESSTCFGADFALRDVGWWNTIKSFVVGVTFPRIYLWKMIRMPGAFRQPKEWVEGFLIVGNHLALDFLNTKSILEGKSQELLSDGLIQCAKVALGQMR